MSKFYRYQKLFLHSQVGLAFREGILTVERNLAYTSQMCLQCPPEYRVVGSRVKHAVTCSNPEHSYQVDADWVGMMNLYRKWAGTFTYPSQKKDESKPATPASSRVGLVESHRLHASVLVVGDVRG